MTESFILIALGIGIGSSITLWLHRPRANKSIDEQVRESGAEVVMFVNSDKKLIVLDAKTCVAVPATSSLQHEEHHHAEIRLNDLGEPILFDTITKTDMVRHEKTASKFRDSTPISTRIHDARIIYFWQYTGSFCTGTSSGGDHYVRCAPNESTSHHLEPFMDFSKLRDHVTVLGDKGMMSEGEPEEATIVRDKDSKTVDSGIWESLTRANDGSVSPPEATDTKSTPPPKPMRYLNARANPQVTLNEEFPLTVQIAGEALTAGGGRGTTGIDGSISGRLLIDVYAPAFKMLDGSTKPLDVPETGRSVPIRFPLQALKPGIQSIEISAWQNSAYVATVTVSVAVDAVPVSDGNVLGDVDLRKPEEHEWSLNITFDPDQKRYSFDFVGPDGFRLDVTGDLLQGHSLDVYDGLLRDLNAQARNLYARQPEEVTAWLQGMGGDMFRTLIPQVIKEAIWERSDRIRRLNIFTRNDPLPWEVLFVTSHRKSEGRFLVDSATVCRWTYGRTWPSSLRKGTPSYVIPGGAPPSAQAEIAVVQALVGSGNTIDDPLKLTALLRSGGFGLMHFAAHNIQPTTPVGGPYIPFAGGQRFDLTYMGSIPDRKYERDSPFIFMNACTSVGLRPIYTELNGWATRFLQCGAGAYVGALWEIRDTSAAKFSEAFYGELTSGKNLGQAMAAGRGAISSGDPTRLAYTLYGNPLGKIE